ncbi:MAG: hypothetical protein ABIK68_10005 [bacterium]
MKFDVYGRRIEVVRHNARWCVFEPGSDGKKRIADDLRIPAAVGEDELIDYLADLCHEWSRQGHDRVVRVT